MNKVVVAVRDSAADAFMSPFVSPSNGMAIRSFGMRLTVLAEGNTMHAHPGDFELWLICEWDETEVCSLRVIVKC